MDPQGKLIYKYKRQYIIKTDEFGNQWTHKIIETSNGKVTETEYNENRTPVAITKNGVKTQFAYDKSGNLIRKETKDYISE